MAHGVRVPLFGAKVLPQLPVAPPETSSTEARKHRRKKMLGQKTDFG